MRLVSLLLCVVSLAARVHAADGDVDTTFGAAGRVTTDIPGDLYVGAIAVHTNGNIVVAGDADGDLFVARYLPGGALDPSFGASGIAVLSLGGDVVISSVLVQPDAKVIVAGALLDGPTTADYTGVVVRLNANGTLDSGFGVGGVSVPELVPRPHRFWKALRQSDGMILALADRDGMGIVRLDGGGVVDATFGTGGLASTGGAERGRDIVLLSDGDIVVAGGDFTSGRIARYTSVGALDPTFGTAGIVALGSVYHAVAAFSDDDVAAADYVSGGPTTTITRFDATGSVVPFGSGVPLMEKIVVPVAAVWSHQPERGIDVLHASSLTIDASDRMLLVGDYALQSPFEGPSRVAVMRFAANGTTDTSFTPCVGATLGMLGEAAEGVLAIQPDGKIVVAAETVPFGTDGLVVPTDRDPIQLGLVRLGNATLPPACVSAAPGGSKLTVVRDPVNTDRNKIRWKWVGSAPVAKADYGSPTSGAGENVCFFWGSSPAGPTYLLDAPGGIACDGNPCWREGTTLFKYRNAVDVPKGLTLLKMKEGSAGAASIVFKTTKFFANYPFSSSTGLASVQLPFTVRVARSDGGACWDATFSDTSLGGGPVVNKLTATSD